jgi:multiple sugar transport system permease protein
MATTTPTTASAPAPKKRGLTLAQREARLAYVLLIPTFLVVLLIVIFPVAWNLWLSFKPVALRDLQSGNLLSAANLTLRNFQRVLAGRNFWPVFQTTVIYTVFGTILSILLGLGAAMIARDYFPGRQLFRGFLLVPYIAPIVAMAFLWRMIFNAQFGIFNEFTSTVLGWPRIDFLTQRYWKADLFGSTLQWPLALTMVILFEAWRYFPFAFLFILARLQALPEDLYEAAAVDGAVPSQRFWYITLPQLRPVIATLVLLRFIWTFNKFDDIYLLNGGVAGTEVITIRIFDLLFGQFQVGRAAALAVVLALFLGVFLFFYFRYVIVEEEAL